MAEITFSGALINGYDVVRKKAKDAKQTIKGLINHVYVNLKNKVVPSIS